MPNMLALCAADHLYLKHRCPTLIPYGTAPDDVTIRMGARVYRNDELMEPRFDETELDRDAWGGTLQHNPRRFSDGRCAAKGGFRRFARS